MGVSWSDPGGHTPHCQKPRDEKIHGASPDTLTQALRAAGTGVGIRVLCMSTGDSLNCLEIDKQWTKLNELNKYSKSHRFYDQYTNLHG